MTRKIFLAMFAVGGLFGQSKLVGPGKTGNYRILDFRLKLNRILPQTITVPEGRYLLRLQNSLTPSAFSLVLDDDKGNRVFSDTQGAGKGKSTRLVDLKAGVHRFFVPGRPQWSVSITVTKG